MVTVKAPILPRVVGILPSNNLLYSFAIFSILGAWELFSITYTDAHTRARVYTFILPSSLK